MIRRGFIKEKVKEFYAKYMAEYNGHRVLAIMVTIVIILWYSPEGTLSEPLEKVAPSLGQYLRDNNLMNEHNILFWLNAFLVLMNIFWVHAYVGLENVNRLRKVHRNYPLEDVEKEYDAHKIKIIDLSCRDLPYACPNSQNRLRTVA